MLNHPPVQVNEHPQVFKEDLLVSHGAPEFGWHKMQDDTPQEAKNLLALVLTIPQSIWGDTTAFVHAL